MKHQELLTKYASEIEAAKAAKAKAEDLRDAALEYDNATDLDDYDHTEAERLARQWEAASYEYGKLMETLRYNVEVEYHDVPFAKPRQQGISAFFATAELA